ncbi:DNA starvation/stationary phase protection protein [Nocardia farcinica]|uniref:DNA protection during starvation protein 2 n=1 Tax=Nocardia farcinica TaxID=37329 RepID=A0A0H5NSC9_NOCFR|nr:DNA starvation/stationary phase protection protein [Nocardia farcinica]AXK85999.1 DNA starvation/stationary phase protection protein [Nocardia farcinica]MBA4858746.1 DNA starvation/stationary phase protection protein [Nocardia farcinica]MBC9816059.1 DNA starvation/stationary phase protection protein [Nocardia farcinica]MBF6231516.1 DNA starvation/stationary phase protection protein [Nocardia farcinica]MBF6252258.1 DNA starvation/stationary phase protection protein [Nocardia farcinica]
MTSTLTKSPITSTLGTAEQKAVGIVLQDALADLIDLSLLGKQAHWNVVGPHFRALHLQLDELVDAARGFVDAVAERAAALGVSPDGRLATVAATSGLPEFPAGYVADAEVVTAIVTTLDTAVRRMRERIEATDTADPVTQDLFIEITAELEKQRWMFQAQS